MSNYNFLTVEKGDASISFLLGWHIARQHYVTARVCLSQGMTNSGCLLSEQSVELFVKALLHLNHRSKDIHYLPKLLERGRQQYPYFNKLLTEPKLLYFIQNLTLVYTAMRFGEGRSNVKSAELIQILDEVAFNLDKLYRETSQSHIVQRARATLKNGVSTTDYEHHECPLYVPASMKDAFLKENKFFEEKDISENFMATVPFP